MTNKQEIRTRCLIARRIMSSEKKRQKSAAICEKLAQNEAILGAKTVLSYLSAPDEADLTAFHTWAKERGIRLAYPISQRSGQMEAAVPEDDDAAIAPGLFGIREPVRKRSQVVAPEELDVVIVPCVGYDSRGNRLGHGGGYYDRFLPQCPRAHTILVAFSEQEVAQIPVEEFDVTTDEIIKA